MSITKYQIFVKVAELGSLTRAAEALGYTQPAVSHSVSSLESRFGFPLFYRSRDACRLTENGERLLPILQYAQNDNSLKLPDEYAVTLSQMLSKAMNKPITFSAGNKSLTKREEQILLLLGSGLSYAEIASNLVISKFTVQKHIQNIYDKLNVSDRVNAIIRAKEYWGIG